jgi:hypothetical protein
VLIPKNPYPTPTPFKLPITQETTTQKPMTSTVTVSDPQPDKKQLVQNQQYSRPIDTYYYSDSQNDHIDNTNDDYYLEEDVQIPLKNSSTPISSSSVPLKSVSSQNQNQNQNFDYKEEIKYLRRPPIAPNAPSNAQSKFSFMDYSPSHYDQSTLKSFLLQTNSSSATKYPKVPSTTTPVSTILTPTKTDSSTVRNQSTLHSAQDLDRQRQKILTYIVSEVQPSSFKAPPTTSTLRTTNINFYNAFVNTQSSSSTTLPSPVTTPPSTTPLSRYIFNSNQTNDPKKTIRLKNEFKSRGTPASVSSRSRIAQEYDEALRSRTAYQQSQSLQLKPIEPTTYTPPKSYKPVENSGRKTISLTAPEANSLQDDNDESSNTRRRPYANPFPESDEYIPRFPPRTTTSTVPPSTTSSSTTTTSSNTPSTTISYSSTPESTIPPTSSTIRYTTSTYAPSIVPPKSTTTQRTFYSSPIPSTNRNNKKQSLNFKSFVDETVQSFTSRSAIFKEALNKTLEPQKSFTRPVVSPFDSLENQRFTNKIRTTTKSFETQSYFSSPSSSARVYTTTPLPVTSTPSLATIFRSYFLITAPPARNVTSTYLLPETTQRSTTPESTTVSSTTPSFIETSSIYNDRYSELPSRGRYRPYTSSSPAPIDESEEPTTYAPKSRYNFKLQTTETSSTTEQSPSSVDSLPKRKVIRLKATLAPQRPTQDYRYSVSTELNRVDSTTEDSLNFKRKYFGYSKDSDYVDKPLKFGYDSVNASKALIKESNVNFNSAGFRPNDYSEPIVEITDKPVYFARYKFVATDRTVNKTQDESTTKKFRATVEMPEMNVPTEKEQLFYLEKENSYDENDDIVDDVPIDSDYNSREHEDTIDYAFVESTTQTSTTERQTTTTERSTTSTSTSTTTVKPTTEQVQIIPNTTSHEQEYSTTSANRPRTTQKIPSTTNPKSLIPPRVSRVNSAIRSSIEASLPRRQNQNSTSFKCSDNSPNAKCNEIPSRYF